MPSWDSIEVVPSAGVPLTFTDGRARQVLSGWVGVYGATAEELRLFALRSPPAWRYADCASRILDGRADTFAAGGA